jgi:hypothetical protein
VAALGAADRGRIRSQRDVAAVDGAGFDVLWAAAAELNAAIGREVFRPVSAVADPPIDWIGVSVDLQNPTPRGVLSSQCDAGQHLCTRRFGQVWMNRGFSFHSIFAPEYRRVSVSELPATVTANDVAYLEMMFALASALETRPAAWTIDEALRATLGPRAGTTRQPPFTHYASPQP